MLNYVIPPIVIVLSLSALVVFLLKKSAKIPDALILKEKSVLQAVPGMEKRKLFKITQIFLKLTEKWMQYFKLLSLKFYNKSDSWFHKVKKKREERVANGKSNLEINQASGIKFYDKGQPDAKRIWGNISRKASKIDAVVIANKIEEPETEPEPMISKEIVRPDNATGFRNEFEKALIERIAINPRDIEAYERLGDYYIEVGNFNDSLSCFEEVMKLSPTNRKAKIKAKRLQKIVYSGLNK